MRIAQISPLMESVPPARYGGTERVVSYLTEELVRQGQDVTLFASGDSRTTAKLVAVTPRALRLDPQVRDCLPYMCMLLDCVLQQARDFDILHFHIDLMQFPLLRSLSVPTVTTLHGRLDLPDLHPFYRAFPDYPLVSISHAQRAPLPPVNWLATVHHGLPADLLRCRPQRGDYLAFLGRICPEKGIEAAIEIAKRAGLPLKIAAKVDAVDRVYFQQQVAPLLDHPLIEFIGEIDERQKNAFLGGARALLVPIDWPEPFGLVMIEAMACGTPVIAFPRGAVPEIVEPGVTGFIVESVEEAVAAIPRVDELDRPLIRQRFERRFTADRMTRDYIAAYERLLETRASIAA
jgi:glycosyltransferase involved in cell wall biosynthesis